MIIAICNNIKELNNNNIFDKKTADRFPGSQWTFHLKEILSEEFDVVTGDIALQMVDSGYDPKNVLVVRELNAAHAKKLVSKGAVPFLLTAFESPLIASLFYDSLNRIAPQYKFRLLYKGAFRNLKCESDKNINITFPSYSKNNQFKPLKWANRSDVVMVVSNKYYLEKTKYYRGIDTKYYAKVKAAEFLGRFSNTKKTASEAQLYDKRLEAIKFFGSKNDLGFDLFGKGWDALSNLEFDSDLIRTVIRLKPQPCLDKINTISNYKFAVCFENISYEGYVTEKIIDCLVAGVIPIYLGAPDIEEFVPKQAFIDFREFNGFEGLYQYLESISEETALEMIQCGQEFLYHKNHNMFCHQDFAAYVAALARGEKSYEAL